MYKKLKCGSRVTEGKNDCRGAAETSARNPHELHTPMPSLAEVIFQSFSPISSGLFLRPVRATGENCRDF